MDKRLKIAVLLPCYNEEITIGDTVAAFRLSLPDASVYVYDNNSTDNTSTVAKTAGAIVRKEPNKGKGNVVRRMFADINADVYVLADGDCTYDANAAPKMIDKLLDERLDMVVGARVEQITDKIAAGHRAGNRIFSKMISFLFGHQLIDVTSGYRVFSRLIAVNQLKH